MSIEHPAITRINKYGYLEEEAKPVLDFLNNEVYIGNEIVVDEDGDFVLKSELEDFLKRKYDFKFKELESDVL